MRRGERDVTRWGIDEWYGRSFVLLTREERRELAALQAKPKRDRPVKRCPFRSRPGLDVACSKEGGVCSIRAYRRAGTSEQASVGEGEVGDLCTTCPYRFAEAGEVYRWIGGKLLGDESPIVVSEIGFLEREGGDEPDAEDAVLREDVGRIDSVLARGGGEILSWCALELQAVYFSGTSMSQDFRAIAAYQGDGVPFPAGRRRPDYRSSGPKRLMPQLQIKVPSLRRWGKKMAVLVDKGFFAALGRMDDVRDVSNCDIAWFVVGYDESQGDARLTREFARLTTLERAVEGLTSGRPVSLETFEARILEKLQAAGVTG
ncbi:MAG: hypothetical protein HY321_16675 [Armatimonadetes bacterium]|nr:hypothetical protein [Armatimonadota bacterium]